MLLSLQDMPKTKIVVSVVAALAASAMLIPSVRSYLSSNLHDLSNRFSSQFTPVIEEYEGIFCEELFLAADTYLGTILTPSFQRVKASK